MGPRQWYGGRLPPNIAMFMAEKKTIRATHPVIVFCSYSGWAVLYSWSGKRVKKIWLSD